MTRRTRRAGSTFVLTLLCLLVIAALYVVILRSTLDLTRTDLGRSADARDQTYLAIHGGVALTAAILGFLIGRIVSGLGLAYAMLFVMLSLALMTSIQIASFSLACNGHNDLIRHWTC